mgnify:CR=1 FL=1
MQVPQFGDPADMEEFLKAPIISRLAPHKLGGPFFTSVPSGRVGQSESHAFRSDKEFVKEVKSKVRRVELGGGLRKTSH